jgi:hypothetical protein
VKSIGFHAPNGAIMKILSTIMRKKKSRGIKIFVLPEEPYHPLTLPGSLSILVDIQSEGIGGSFRPFFIDAGMGMITQSLLARAVAIERKTIFHIVVLADSFEYFKSGLSQVIQSTGGSFNSLPVIKCLLCIVMLKQNVTFIVFRSPIFLAKSAMPCDILF